MNLKLNKILGLFKNVNINKSNKNYMKNKNIYLIIFSTILVAAISFVVIFFNFFEYNINFKNKSIIDIPYTEKLSDDELNEIKELSSDIFHTNCTVQTSIAFPEMGLDDVKKISINCLSNISRQNPSDQKNIDVLINELSNMFPKQISIKNKEEVLITNVKTADIEDFNIFTYLIALSIVLALIMIYFMFTFRKINGFLVSLSFFVGLVFNTAVVFSLFLISLLAFNLTLNKVTVIPLFAVLACVIVNYIINANMLFSELKNQIINRADESSFKDIANNVINKQKKNFIYNLLTFALIPSVPLIFLNITSVSFLSFIVVGLVSGICCFLLSHFIITQIFFTLKNKKKLNKQPAN